jgi:hypothetical protein
LPHDTYRILVTGSREYGDYDTICRELASAWPHLAVTTSPVPRIVVVHGACPTGADALGARAALALGMDAESHPADWHPDGGKLDRGAGFRRNALMVSLGADICLAFYQLGAGNKGTDHCAKLAEKAGIPVRRCTA